MRLRLFDVFTQSSEKITSRRQILMPELGGSTSTTRASTTIIIHLKTAIKERDRSESRLYATFDAVI